MIWRQSAATPATGYSPRMQGAQRLSSLDASFLHLETADTPMHIGGVAIFEPSPAGSGEALFQSVVETIERRLELLPRYRQRIALVPLHLDAPVWVDDPDFDLRNHVLRAALPSPGGDGELQALVSRIFARPLDRRRPLWEIYVVEGLMKDRWALLTKTHHSMVDGISNLELATILLDVDPRAENQHDPRESWKAQEQPGARDLLLESLRRRVGRPARMLSAARAVLGRPAELGEALRHTARGLAVMAQTMRHPRSVLNGPTGPSRQYEISRFALEDFRSIKNALGGTINDVVLTAVTGGLRHFLTARGVDPTVERLQALCPVSIRDASERATLGNRLAMLLVQLPIEEPDPIARLARMRRTIDRLKARRQAAGAEFLLNLAGFAPATLHAMVARGSLRRMGFNLVVTNVPGPQFPLYCRGAQLLEAFPIAFLYQGQHLSIAVFSYCGQLNVGYLADGHAIPDLGVLATCVEQSVAEMLDAARAVAVPARRARPRRRAATRAR